jgi:hypothetical protein
MDFRFEVTVLDDRNVKCIFISDKYTSIGATFAYFSMAQ